MLYAESSGFRFIVVHAMESYLWPFWKKKKKKKVILTLTEDLLRGETKAADEKNKRVICQMYIAPECKYRPSPASDLALCTRQDLFVLLLCREFHLLVSKAIACKSLKNILNRKKGQLYFSIVSCPIKSHHWLVNDV